MQGRAAARSRRRVLTPLSPALLLTFAVLLHPERAEAFACVWTGASSTSWTTAGNWSSCNATIPQIADTVTVSSAANLPTIAIATSVTISGLTINSGATVTVDGTLALQGSSTGSGNLTVNGALNWSSGTMSGSGVTTIAAGGTLDFLGAAKTLDGRTINNAGTATVSGPAVTLTMANGAIFNNQASGSFEIRNDSTIASLGTGNTFNNPGTFSRTLGSGIATVGAVFNNTGTVNITSGTLSFSGSGTNTHTGPFNATGGTLRFNGGTHNVNAGANVTGTEVTFDLGTITIASTYNVSGTTSVNGATVGFTPASTITSLGATLTVTLGTLNLASGDPIALTTLTLTTGTLSGSDNITVSGVTTWSGGTMSGSGTTSIAPGGTLDLLGAAKTLDGRTLNNAGTATVSGAAVTLTMANGAAFNNQASGSFEIQNDSTIANSGTASTFNNQGTVSRTLSSGIATVGVVFNNAGTVNIASGTLSFAGSGTNTHTGPFNATGGTLRFNGGTHSVNAGANVTGTNVTFDLGTITIASTYNVSGTTSVNGATVGFASASTITSKGTAMTVTLGTLNLTSGEAIALTTLTLSGGILSGSDNVTVSGAMTWSGGTMSGSGTTTIASGGTLDLLGVVKTLDGRTLNNAGTATVSGPAVTLTMANGAIFNNQASGSFEVQNDSTIASLGTGSTFNNQGTFSRTLSSGIATVGVVFNNMGTVNITSGTLSFSGSGINTHTGPFNATGGTLRFSGGTHSVNAGANVTGTNVTFDLGTITIASTYSVSGTTSVNGATVSFTPASTITSKGTTLTVTLGNLNLASGEAIALTTLTLTTGTLSGSDNVTVTGLMTWSGGTMSGSGVTTIAAGGTLDFLGAVKTLDGRTLNNAGTATVSGPAVTLTMANGAIFNNQASGSFEVQNDSTIASLGTGSMFNNQGTFNRTLGSGTATVGVVFNNTGTVNITSGTLSFSGSGINTHAGPFNATGGTLRFNGGTHIVNAGANLTGTNVTFDLGTITIASTFNVTGTTSVNGATVGFTPASTITSLGATLTVTLGNLNLASGDPIALTALNLSAGTLSGSDNVTVTGVMTWSGGTMSGSGTTTIVAGGTLDLLGAAKNLGRNLNNAGTATVSGTAVIWTMANEAVFNNQASGSFEIQNDGTIANSGTGSTFNNLGTFSRSVSSGTATIGVVFSNAGTVNAQSGVLSFTGTYTQTAGGMHLTGGDILSNGAVNIQGGVLDGNGNIAGGLVVSGSGQLSPGASPGVITIAGNYTQSSPAALNIELSGTGAGQFDHVAASGSAAIGGTLNVTLLAFAPSPGDTFPLLTYASQVGSFGTLNLPALSGGLSWTALYAATAFSLRIQALLPDGPLRVDIHAPFAGSPNLNGVLDPGERVVVEPTWENPTAGPIAFTAAASNFTGPTGATYAINDAAANYGTVTPGASSNCFDATGNCYEFSVDDPPTRPAAHWDTTFDETASDGDLGSWTIHVGGSFNDISQTAPQYYFVETLFHNLVTSGCGGGAYCPDGPTTRAQMAVFLLKASQGSSYTPPVCSGVFGDVTCPSQFADWIEDLFSRGITAGCGGGNYCPTASTTRGQMAVFLLKTSLGPGYVPPACAGIFADVPCPGQDADWIEDLFNRGITAGCGGGNYCPTDPVTRGQMAVFLTNTFGLRLNGP